MTSEIAVLNRFGLAIAADSAVTVEQFHENEVITKTYNSANKLFRLSKHAPVAVMFYNTVMVCGLPWETVVKAYRKSIGKSTFDTIDEYCASFFSFLTNNHALFPEERVQRAVCFSAFRELNKIKNESRNRAQFSAKVNDALTAVKKLDRISHIDEAFSRKMFASFRAELESWVSAAIPASYIQGNKKIVFEFLREFFSRKKQSGSYSGLVIAGFGEGEYLPKLRHFICDGFVDGHLRYWEKQSVDISEFNTGEVIPLADSEVTQTIVSGINPRFKDRAYELVIKVMVGIPSIIIDNIPGINSTEKKDLISSARKSIFSSFKEFYDGIEKLRKKNYEDPINTTISSLPVAELGAVAETFINASHIHKRVNPGFETVGGPVDVAVISKGDGFVWVKRKHYFDAAINPTFALSYLE